MLIKIWSRDASEISGGLYIRGYFPCVSSPGFRGYGIEGVGVVGVIVLSVVVAGLSIATQWAAYSRAVARQRYSPLAQITPQNVVELEAAST